ncbi:MAG: DUF448 domain-containing protein [Candidatus Obscuribacter sp.]|nr:DUF448 domain-containing protein [Candidatus Obscuribacter sp.]MBK9279316.1 DUF448 domain-containing protein [Candidatus Obscuribacter sp.]
MACRVKRPQQELVRVTYDFRSGCPGFTPTIPKDFGTEAGGNHVKLGRSAYFCPSEACLHQVLTTTKLKAALEGRRKKGVASHRRMAWPLEAQLIEALTQECSNRRKTCQNTERYGEG